MGLCALSTDTVSRTGLILTLLEVARWYEHIIGKFGDLANA